MKIHPIRAILLRNNVTVSSHWLSLYSKKVPRPNRVSSFPHALKIPILTSYMHCICLKEPAYEANSTITYISCPIPATLALIMIFLFMVIQTYCAIQCSEHVVRRSLYNIIQFRIPQ
jgi:hypothetical protein